MVGHLYIFHSAMVDTSRRTSAQRQNRREEIARLEARRRFEPYFPGEGKMSGVNCLEVIGSAGER